MQPHSAPRHWLEVLGWVSLVFAFASATYILCDIYINRYRQKMTIMEVVYPATALYLGPAAVWFYRRYGRRTSTKVLKKQSDGSSNRRLGSRGTSPDGRQDGPATITWNQTAEAVTHCGAGCTLGDIIAEWSVLAVGITIAGTALYADIVFDFILAWLLGVIFQYCTIMPMRQLRPLQGIKEAIKADTLSIVAFQTGLFAGMIIYQMLIFSNPLPKTSASYWFLMQLSMALGFITAYPVNRWLIRHGVKQAM